MSASSNPQPPLRLLLVGDGRMGRAIEQLAASRGFVVKGILGLETNREGAALTPAALADVDVVVEFTQPEAVLANVRRVAAARGRIVVGTTGWYDRLDEARTVVEANGAGLVYGPNFSLGVQLFYRVARDAARFCAGWPQFEPYIVETHHRFKRDAPSGTAQELARQVAPALGGRLPAIQSVRAGYVPGTHELGFDGEGETLIVRHSSRTRQAYAEGALVAARRLAGQPGFWSFSEILEREERT